MPYINYLNIAAYKAECGRVMRLYDDVGAIRTAKEWGRLPIMRVYEPREIGDILPERDEYITRLINLARGRGYAGICLGAFKARGDEWEDVLFQLKKRMIDEGLILLSEIDANAEQKPDTVSDFCILFYEKANLYEIPTFANGERRIFEHYAKEADPTRMFMDFSPFAYADKTPISHREAYDLAYRAKREIEYEEESKICSFEYNKYLPGEKKKTRITIESPENIKAKLELVSELGYMGISFDVMRAPTSHIMTMATSCVMGVDYLSSSAEI